MIKKILLTLALVSTLVVAGCATTTAPITDPAPIIYVDSQGLLVVAGVVVQPAMVGDTIGLGVTIGVGQVVQSDTNALAYFKLAKVVIDASLNNGNYDPISLQLALNTISVSELRDSAVVKSIIKRALNAYARYAGAVTAQGIGDVSPYLKPILQGISDGIGAVTQPQLKAGAPK